MGKYSKRFELKINENILKKTVKKAIERNIVIPTFAQQKNPDLIPESIKSRLAQCGPQDVNPVNLFRITWKNDVKTGLFGNPDFVELPSSVTGVKARIVGIVGKHFPTGAHKVGAAFGCLVPRLVSGNFDPTSQKAVWPSTGNYCRGGAFDCALLACPAIAILPEEMSRERFEWLENIGTDEIFATPGCESNVKEIYDKCWDLRKERGDKIVIFNQFEEFGNPTWHYHVTASAAEDVFNIIKGDKGRFFGWVSATGSAGTIGAGDYFKKVYPNSKVIASEAIQCPTLLSNGFGGHRIEGIGDKHVPWVHNLRNTDMVVAVDDEACMRMLRVFNEPDGHAILRQNGVSAEVIEKLNLLGISSISNVLSAIKAAKYWECDENDILFTPLTDSAEMYLSRLDEQTAEKGAYSETQALVDFERYWLGEGIQNLQELTYSDRKKIHNLKYFTWVEQQGKTYEEILELWDPEFWDEAFSQVPKWDELINEFNSMTGLG
ncbi:MAG: pyridoxal-5-phosphate-dependent protein subunit beta [Candidatus Wallbacteria bacterium HGW-Wallbacteria-1]|uniref:Pyridoxal-5-phosphate-dependent protein subunit beta n=1 Tax=Candidatus Wallbacteria bacterium HGW-Wallbacteria-1 TaxID=2013854 RepID=A0A2N1PKJ1_9BACT|nr:MAG: pyridoxal-5-phosphate-dependent protein subunit beta [Candidatus Wallbacteria bacterium HGW-Wallbacteria-1]